MPDRAATTFDQVSSTVKPSGETAPIPVTRTRSRSLFLSRMLCLTGAVAFAENRGRVADHTTPHRRVPTTAVRLLGSTPRVTLRAGWPCGVRDDLRGLEPTK